MASRNRYALGHVKGEHVPFVVGHSTSNPGRSEWFHEEDRGHHTTCHIWRGVKIKTGYGRVTVEGRKRLAHVVAWERLHGSVPDGCVLDHLCRQVDCVNPEHLEPVTQRVNCRRGASTKLTFEQAQTIKRSTDVARVVASKFSISPSTVAAIRSGRTWKDA